MKCSILIYCIVPFAILVRWAPAEKTSRAANPPNLVFILTDQQRFDTLGAYGNRQIQTPHLDRLAGRGVLFERAYVAFPLCSPDRASLQNGVYPHSHGTWDNNIPLSRDFPTLVEMVKQTHSKYVTGYFGKWHLGNEFIAQRGFDEFDTTENYSSGASRGRSGYSEFLMKNGIRPDQNGQHSRDLANRMPKKLSKPTYVADKAIDFIASHRRQPFLLYLSFLEPHAFADHNWGPPFKNVNDGLYPPEQIKIPDTFYEPMDASVSFEKQLYRVLLQRGEFPVAYPRTEAELRDAIARYWGLVTLVDEMVGRVVARLQEYSLEENTIIIFTSEHGEMLGDHRLMSKRVTYEESIRIPLLLVGPGVKPRSVVKPVSQIDLVPTILDLLDTKAPAHLPGKSWADPLRTGHEFPVRDVIVESTQTTWKQRKNITHSRTIITPTGWKLTVSEMGDTELYNLNRDPHERSNLAPWETYRGRVDQLLRRIRRWQRTTQDVVKLDLQGKWPEAFQREAEQRNLRRDLNKPWPQDARVRGNQTHRNY